MQTWLMLNMGVSLAEIDFVILDTATGRVIIRAFENNV